MNILIWTFQILMGMFFIRHGMMFLTLPDKAKERIPWVLDLNPSVRKFTGVAEILGGIGLILPWGLGILIWLTPLAAVGIGLTMVGAILFHISRQEYKGLVMNVVLLAIMVSIASYRWVALAL